MKNYLLLFACLIIFSACKEEKKEVVIEETPIEKTEIITRTFPEKVEKVLNAHGGIKLWDSFNTLEFTMKKPKGDEKTVTDLKDRRSFIETDAFKMGYDGNNSWLLNKGDNEYKGNPNFYYNLMFYFYGMPFVLADDGITYSDVEPLKVNNVEYPGFKVSYNAGVGESPDDEYILYYDANTNKMAWLGYTVTYSTKEKSNDFHFIKYADWQTVNGVVLPKMLQWYNAEGFVIGDKRNDLLFTDIVLTKNTLENSFYEKPAEIAGKK